MNDPMAHVLADILVNISNNFREFLELYKSLITRIEIAPALRVFVEDPVPSSSS